MLYVSDLDGTLVNNNTMNIDSISILNEEIENGICFTLASARDYNSIRKVARGLDIRLPVIALDGSYIIDFASGERLVVNQVQRQALDAVLDVLHQNDLRPFIAATDMKSDFLLHEGIRNDHMEWCTQSSDYFKDQHFSRVMNTDGFFEYACTRIILTHNTKDIVHVEKILRALGINGLRIESYENYYIDGASWLIISSSNATKYNALLQLLQILDTTEQDVLYFGDHFNDLDIFKSCIYSIAVSNAKREVIDLADLVIGESTKNSVAKFVRDNKQKKSEANWL